MSGAQVHTLKCWPRFFIAIAEDQKTYEVRVGDREFRVGDTLQLIEWDPITQKKTGRGVDVLVTSVEDLGTIGLDGWRGMSIRRTTLVMRTAV